MSAIITCNGLTKHYGRHTALTGLTVTMTPGVVGLLGPNGAGKSTLISVLLGQTPLNGGQAEVLGLDVRRQQPAIRRRVGFMPENDCLILGLTGVGYVHYTGRLAGMSHSDAMQRAHEVLDYVGLDEARYRKAEQYSTGMKQRLKLAQALVHDPDLLFLDEPTNGMDPLGRQMMLSLISDLGQAGISVVLSSHLLHDVEQVCGYVVIMGGGELLTTGAIDEMNEPHPTRYTLDCVNGADGLDAALQQRQITVHATQADGRRFIELPAPDTQRLVLEAIQASGARLRGFEPERSSLEATFLLALRKQESA